MKISVFDTLLLDDGKIIKFNTYYFSLILKEDGKYYICLSESVERAVRQLELPKDSQKELFKVRKVIAKVNIKCELIKKYGSR